MVLGYPCERAVWPSRGLDPQVETTALEEENGGDGNEEHGYNNKGNSGGEHHGETWVNEGQPDSTTTDPMTYVLRRHSSESFIQLESALHLNSSSGKYSCVALSKSLGLSGKISVYYWWNGNKYNLVYLTDSRWQTKSHAWKWKTFIHQIHN